MRTPLYDITSHHLLGERYAKLDSSDEQDVHQCVAEMLLGLSAPVYTGSDADDLAYAIILQVNFQLEQGITPSVMKSISNNHPGNTTTYRDRYLSPAAYAIAQRVTGVKQVRFQPPGFGV